MSPEDVQVFRSTIRQAINTPDPDKPSTSIWQNAADMHSSIASEIHNGATFFFWHRIFLSSIEKKLQTLNPKFYFPYWQAANEFQSGRWQNSVAMSLTDLTDTSVKTDRDLQNMDLISPAEWADLIQQSILNRQGFNHFAPSPQAELLHGTLHVAVGGTSGDMSRMRSPRDALFYLHHANLDVLWSNAQVEWGKRDLPQVGAAMPDQTASKYDSPIPGFNNKFADVLDISNVCVRYAPPGEKEKPPVTTTTTTSIRPTTTTTTTTITTTTVQPTTTITTTSMVTTSSSDSSSSTSESTSTSTSSSPIITSTTISSSSITSSADSSSTSHSLSHSTSLHTSTEKSTTTSTTTTINYGPTNTYVPPVKPDSCKPLPVEWLKMNGFSTLAQQKATEQCKKVKAKVASGEKIAPVKHFNQTEISSVLSKVIPANVTISPPSKPNYGSFYSSSAQPTFGGFASLLMIALLSL